MKQKKSRVLYNRFQKNKKFIIRYILILMIIFLYVWYPNPDLPWKGFIFENIYMPVLLSLATLYFRKHKISTTVREMFEYFAITYVFVFLIILGVGTTYGYYKDPFWQMGDILGSHFNKIIFIIVFPIFFNWLHENFFKIIDEMENT